MKAAPGQLGSPWRTPRFLGKEAVLGCAGARAWGEPHSGFLSGLPVDMVLTLPRGSHGPGSLWPSRDIPQRAGREVQMPGLWDLRQLVSESRGSAALGLQQVLGSYLWHLWSDSSGVETLPLPGSLQEGIT